MSQRIDIIYHSASAVNFIQPYSYMKRDNVQGLFRDNMVNGQSTVQLYQNTYQWDCSNLKYFLQHSGIEEPHFTRQMLLNYLRQSIGTSQQSLQV
ncbi:SDR family oxidoreductase [Serratia proteamaculans]|uniref:SDR family oxidoreductase n=1 Tax=Serratia proteamaculans TaxID=28151 RepID=UPI0021B796BC|nr:SDR family oxidoreductase [Serratia proteamaculans]